MARIGYTKVRPLPAPYIPPSCAVAACVWLGMSLGIESQMRRWLAGGVVEIPSPTGMAISCIVFALLILGYVSMLVRKTTSNGHLHRALVATATLVLAVVVGVQCGQAKVTTLVSQREALKHTQSSSRLVRPVSDPRRSLYGWYGDAELVVGKEAHRVTIRYPNSIKPLELGEEGRVEGSVTLTSQDPASINVFLRGTVGSLALRTVKNRSWITGYRGWLGAIRHRAMNAIGNKSPGQAFAQGILLGDMRPIDRLNLREPFVRTGLSHILAVSGSHLGVVAALVVFTCSSMWGKRKAYIITAVLTAFYVVLTGASPAAVRAWGMFLVMTAALLIYRRSSALHGLGVVTLVYLFADPLLVYSLGFQLSVLAVAGICLFYGLVRQWTIALWPVLPDAITANAAVSIVAYLATLPLSIQSFGTVSLMSIPANLAVGPIASLALGFGFVGLATEALHIPVARYFFWITGQLSSISVLVAQRLSSVWWALAEIKPAMWMWVVFSACIIVLRLWSPMPKKEHVKVGLLITGFIVGAFALSWLVPQVLVSDAEGVAVLDVGQGDATLVQSNECNVLIDTGPSTSALIYQLSKRNIHAIDTVIFTHDHADHVGASDALGRYNIKRMIVADGASESLIFRKVATSLHLNMEEVGTGDVLKTSKFTITALWPNQPVKDSGANESSLILLVQETKTQANPKQRNTPPQTIDSMLISGDAEADTIERALEQNQTQHQNLPQNSTLNIDVLKVAHHGSAGAVTDELLARLSPRIGVISVGADNSYGHPAPSTLMTLGRHVNTLHRTDQGGTRFYPF